MTQAAKTSTPFGPNAILATWRRELQAYFTTPLAYVFIAVFLISLSSFTWELSRFFDTGAADLGPFFYWHPWFYMLFMPALSMRLWSDERSGGTLELLLSLPVSVFSLVMGKLLAAWCVAGLALCLTFPWWIAVNILGAPDNGAIGVAYGMSLLMAGAYLALGSAVSALTRSSVLAFVIGVVLAFILTAAGWPLMVKTLSGLLGAGAGEAVAAFSFLTPFEAAQRGILELRSVIFYGGFIGLCVALNTLLINYRRSGSL